jgi:hypothetical protein
MPPPMTVAGGLAALVKHGEAAKLVEESPTSRDLLVSDLSARPTPAATAPEKPRHLTEPAPFVPFRAPFAPPPALEPPWIQALRAPYGTRKPPWING